MTQEDFFLVLSELDRAQRVREAVARDHRTRHARCLADVVDGARCHLVVTEREFLGDAAAERDADVGQHLLARQRKRITLRQAHDHAQRATTRNDGCLVDGIGALNIERHDRVPRFVERSIALFFFAHDERAALGAHHHLVLGVFELGHGDDTLAASRSEQRCLVHEIGEVGAREARRAARNRARFDIGTKRHFAHMDAQDFLAAREIGIRHYDFAVEPAGTQQCRIQNVWAVGRRNQNDAFVRLEAVHFDEQLIEGLLALVIAAAKAGAAMPADRIDFIDEDDAGRILLGLFEHVAHAARTDAHEHLDEVRARDGEEGNVRLARNRTREQGLARARRAHEKNALGNPSAQTLEFLRVAKKVDDLLQIVLGFIDAGHILEGHAPLALGQKLGAALAETHCLAATRLHLA